MKKNLPLVRLLSIVVFSLLATLTSAQVSNYTFSQSSGIYTPITGGTQFVTTTSGAVNYDIDGNTLTLPTASQFTYNGTLITNVNMTADGSLWLNTTNGNNITTPIANNTSATGVICALGMDLRSTSLTGQIYERRWQDVGSEIVFQWQNAARSLQNTAERFSFQIRITKATGVISVVYGNMTTIASSSTYIPQVGLRGTSNTDYNSRRLTTTFPDNTPSWDDTGIGTTFDHNVRFTSTAIAAFPAAGKTFIWTPPAPCTKVSAFPFTESFEGITSGVPNCWGLGGTTTNPAYNFGSFATGQTGKGLRFDSYFNTSGLTGELTSPVFDLSSLTTAQLKFYYKNPTGGNFQVLISSNGGTTYTSLETALTGQTAWSQRTYDITSYISNNVKIKFVGTSNYGNGDAYIYLDEFNILSIPTCNALPSSLAASTITTSSATISWTAASPVPAEGYDYYVTTSATAPTSATVPNATVSGVSVNVTSLSAATTYYYWVRSRCNSSNQSSWVSGGTFVTACAVPNNPTALNITNPTSTGFTLNFTAASPAPTSYILFVSTGNITTIPPLVAGTSYVDGQDYIFGGQSYRCITNNAVSPQGLINGVGNTKYNYFLFSKSTTNACFGNPYYSSGSTISAITCPAVPVIGSPEITGLTAATATVNWLAPATDGGAAPLTYSIELANNAGFTGSTIYSAGTGFTYGFTGLTANTTYFYRVKANNGCDSPVLNGSFYTGYCNPTNGTVTPLTYISNFSTSLGFTNNINNNPSIATPGGYQDNYVSMQVQTIINSSINFSMNISGNNANGKVGIWIDWNRNLIFESSERVFNDAGNSAIINGSITVPIGVALGDYRMRVKVDRYGGTAPIDPCVNQTANRAETEDYKFTVVAAPDYRVYTTNTGVNNTINDTLDIYFEDYDGINNFYTFGQTEIWMYSGLQTVDGIFQYQPTGQDENILSSLIKFTQTTAGIPNVYKATIKLSDYYCPVTTKNVEGINLYFRNQFDAIGNNRTANLFLDLTDATLQLNAPTLTATTAITQTSATINWTAPAKGAIRGYDYYYSTDPTAPNAATTPNGSTAKGTVTANLAGLTSATTYNFWVRTQGCFGENSVWSSVGTFTTLCPITPITVTEGFNAPTIPTCWTVQFPSATNFSFVTGGTNPTTSPAEGSHMVSYNSYSTSTDERLRSLPMSSTGNPSVDVEFMWRNDNTAYTAAAYDTEGVQVQYSLNGTTWTNVPGGFFKRSDTSLPAGTAAWSKKTITLPAAAGNRGSFYVGFNFISELGNNMYMDAVVIQPTPKPITVTSSETLPLCSGTPTILTANSAAAYAYTWSPATGLNSTMGASVVATPIATTTYTVTGTLGSVSTTKNFTVTVNPAPTNITVTETPVSTGGVTACDLDYVQLTASGGLVPIVSLSPLLSEQFTTTTTTLPSGWQNQNDDIYSYWRGTATSDAGGNPNEMYLDVSNSLPGDFGTYALRSPTLDTSNWSTLSLSFKSYLDTYSTTIYPFTIKVQSSTDGNIWTDRYSFSPTATGFLAAQTIVVDLSAVANVSTVSFRFALVGYPFGLFDWSIDDVVITGSAPGQQISWSPITGLYTDTALTIPYVANANVATVYAAPDVATNFTAAAKIGTCDKSAMSTSIIRTKKEFSGADATNPTLWNVAANWSTNTLPTIDKCVSIPSTKNAVVNIPDAVAKKVTIADGGTLTINANQTLKLQDELINNNTGANAADKVVVASDGNLIQVNPTAANTGAVTAERAVTGLRNIPGTGPGAAIDYVFWSSPVSGQQTKGPGGFSPGTPNNRFYDYRESNDRFYETVDTTFKRGKGYAVRAEGNQGPAPYTAPYDKTYTFKGALNNGDINIDIKRSANTTSGNPPVTAVHGYNMVGNPYPSNISFDQLYAANSAKIYNLAYFWTNAVYQPTQGGSGYAGNNYAVYNGTGGNPSTSAPNGYAIPNGIIKVGQGFIVQKKLLDSSEPTLPVKLEFKNSYGSGQDLRVSSTGTFYQKDAVAKNRYTLQLTSPDQLVNSQLIGYIAGATDGYEQDYDAEAFALSSNLFYSTLNNKRLLIQGKSASFTTQDTVNLGVNFFQNGAYLIALANTEGIFANGQNVYLKDKLNNTVTNLSQGSYSFISTVGENTGRFEIIYEPETVLATDATSKEELVVYKDSGDFVVKAQSKKITNLQVFDMNGRLILNVQPHSTKAVIPAAGLINGVYLLKVNQNGVITNKKIIH